MKLIQQYAYAMMVLWSLIVLVTSPAMAIKLQQRLTIHFATEATYPPFESINASGELIGFDIEIAKAICQQLKARCLLSNQPFTTLIESLQIGKFDAVIAGMGITVARKQQVAFSLPYYEPSASFVSLAKNHYRIADLRGQAIGVQQGTTFEQYLHQYYRSKVKIKTYFSAQTILLDLLAERLAAGLVDTAIASVWTEPAHPAAPPVLTLVERPIIDHAYFGAGYGIAVAKHNYRLLSLINQALSVMKKNGVYHIIFTRYFETNDQPVYSKHFKGQRGVSAS